MDSGSSPLDSMGFNPFDPIGIDPLGARLGGFAGVGGDKASPAAPGAPAAPGPSFNNQPNFTPPGVVRPPVQRSSLLEMAKPVMQNMSQDDWNAIMRGLHNGRR